LMAGRKPGACPLSRPRRKNENRVLPQSGR
jgi:hypothetical protein